MSESSGGGSGAATIGISLKTYFSHARTLAWLAELGRRLGGHEAVRSGRARVFVVPQSPSIPAAIELARPAGIEIGAQDVSEHAPGAHTGEVTASVLVELGVTLAEIGHAERRRDHGETEQIVRGKVAAAVRSGLAPVLCVGEVERLPAHAAVDVVLAQLESALEGIAPAEDRLDDRRIVVAYEPVWAIGADRPADPSHVLAVGSALRERLRADPRFDDVAVIYGGSAGVGMLGMLWPQMDGLFLGRRAHDPAAVVSVLDEIPA